MPSWRLIAKARQRSFSVHGGDRPIESQAFGKCGESPRAERGFEAALSLQQRRSTSCADPRCTGHLVGGIAAQGDEIRNLLGIDAIALTNLVWTDTRHLACADGVEDGGAVGGKLERVAVAARNENRAAALFFFCGSGGEKIVCFEAWGFRILKAACGNKFRQNLELLEQSVIEFTSALEAGSFSCR